MLPTLQQGMTVNQIGKLLLVDTLLKTFLGGHTKAHCTVIAGLKCTKQL